MSMSFESYMKDHIQPMRDQLTGLGITELRTPEEVEEAFQEAYDGTMMVVINSVCGCAAGQARPGVAMALRNEKTPNYLYTVFAGQDKDATAKAREKFEGYAPSSPSIAILKNGKMITMVERYQVEDQSAEEIAKVLQGLFDEYCD